MAINYTTVDENDFGQGIDARSGENQLNPGFVQDLLNGDIVEKRARQRTGYQGYSGNLPVRVLSFEYRDTLNQLCMNLDGSIDLGSYRSTPLVISGRSSNVSSGGPFLNTTNNTKYYSGFLVPTRKVMVATASAPPYESIAIPAEEHSLPTSDMFVSITEATNSTDRSYQAAIPHDVIIDLVSNDIDIQYQNSTGTDRDVFVFYKDKQAVVGSSYVATLSHTGSGSESFSISAGTHALTNFNIIAQCQQDLGTEVAIVKPDSLVIEPDGDVVVSLNASSATTFYVLLSAADITNQVTGNVSGNSTGAIVLTGLTSPWLFYGIYLELTAGGDKELVYPDNITYDEGSQTATIEFQNNSSVARNFVCYYEYGVTRSNQICVTDASITIDATDVEPQLTIWGLDHAFLYGDAAQDRAGWVSHIDTYRSTQEQRLVAGLGGNLFDSRTYEEAGSDYLYAQLYPNLRNRTAVASTLGPLFFDTGETPARTRGYILSDNSGTNWALISAVEYDSGNGWTKYTVSLPSKQILDSTGTATPLTSVISTTSGLEDWLTVQDMSYSRHNGTFRIRQVQDGTNQILIWVENSSNSADYNDMNTGGEAAVFTDQLTLLTTSQFLPGDSVQNAAISPDEFICNAVSSSGTTLVLDGLMSRLDIAPGLTTVGERTSSVVPLRSAQPSASNSVTNLVVGDMLSYSEGGFERLLRVLYINPDQDRTVSISGDGEIATVTLGSGDTSYLTVGKRISLTQAGVYSSHFIVNSILSSTEFTILSENATVVTGATLQGKTAELDEELTWSDSTDDSLLLRIESRLIPIEAPEDSYGLTPSTYIHYLNSGDYDFQPFLRSCMVQNNLYLTNGQDDVLKYDGTNNYRAGLFPWQPGLFLTQDTGATAKIIVDNPSTNPDSVLDNIFKVPLGDENKFPIGFRIRHSYTGGFNDYTVLNTYVDNTHGYVKVQRTSTSPIVLGASHALTLMSVRRYYYRLNAVDANNNIVASAVTGSQDHIVELAQDAAVNHKVVGLPAWGVYDYDRLEVEIYGTKLNSPAPFYKLTTLQMSFDNGEGYINYTDSFSDSDLIELDVINTALLGAELGLNWEQPLRAKYTTSIGGSLVLGNMRDYPELDLQIIASGAVSNTTYTGKRFLLRKQNTDAGTTTSMPLRAGYELRSVASSAAVSGATGTAGTSFLVTVTNTAVAGDWVYLHWSTVALTGRSLKYAGWWQISAATGSNITINFPEADAGTITSSVPDKALFATDPTDIPVPLGVDGNMGMVNGDSFDLFDVGRRLSMAINASMRMVDTSISGMDSFRPWLTARGGNDVGKAGRVIIRQPYASNDMLELLLPSSFIGGGFSFDVFVNEIRRSAGAQVSASTKLFPSRITVSYENYPELFDNPTSILDTESDSAIDINASDGQEITGIIPFFGESAYGAAQQAAVLVVFKQYSIYLVDINEKRAGRNAVQRIETEGLGCTAPYSIAVTKNGIIFANESGIYCLRRNQTIEYIGQFMERNWTERVNLDQLAIAQGHHYGVGRTYKLSVPLDGDTSNSEVYVYNHTGEKERGIGSWGRYDNHPATGWANLAANAFFGSTKGRVFSLRNTGTESDFRDDSAPITFRLDTRAMDFGNSNIRKVLDKVIAKYRTMARNTGTVLYCSIDTSETYTETTPIVIPKPKQVTGLDDETSQAIFTVSHSVKERRGTYFSIRIENTLKDQNVEVAGIGCRVGGLEAAGIIEAEATRSK